MPKRVEINIKVPSQTRYLAMIGQIGESLAFSLNNYQGNRRELAYHINLCLTEGLTNAICHGNNSDPDKDVHITISASDDDLVIRIYDQGPGFDISARGKTNAQPCDEGGRGINIILKLMDNVKYLQENGVNVLEMTKALQ
ncbi:MAG TPA: ATP-binding protein [Pelovirga sp.]|nr:ATP-binding protein [Pelovirga sp.]